MKRGHASSVILPTEISMTEYLIVETEVGYTVVADDLAVITFPAREPAEELISQVEKEIFTKTAGFDAGERCRLTPIDSDHLS